MFDYGRVLHFLISGNPQFAIINPAYPPVIKHGVLDNGPQKPMIFLARNLFLKGFSSHVWWHQRVNPPFSYGFPMVFPHFSSDFPSKTFIFHHFPMVFPWFSHSKWRVNPWKSTNLRPSAARQRSRTRRALAPRWGQKACPSAAQARSPKPAQGRRGLIR